MLELQISDLDLTEISGFKRLSLAFSPGLNIICGENGVGKTTILESIATVFTPHRRNNVLKKRAASSEDIGHVRVLVSLDNKSMEITGNVNSTEPESEHMGFGLYHESVALIVLRANRDFGYTRRNTISRDPELDHHEIQARNTGHPAVDELKQWFANRYLMQPHGKDWPKYRMDNLETAKSLFNALNKDFALKYVDTSTFDILVETPDGVIPFEFLSSGFRSAFALLIGIIKEIEFRKLEVSAAKFTGVILIDEVDLHLHPSWQREIGGVLKATFPLAQIIATTHSPHVIQAAEASEVLALTKDAEGRTTSRELPVGEFGFAGWTIEEILQDVMGVDDTQTAQYREAVRAFDDAVDSNDEAGTTAALGTLEKMLHPSSPMRKVFEIQASVSNGGEL